MVKINRALLSVSDKKGIVKLAKGLHELGVEILSTGGTARELEQAGIPVRSVSDYTGFSEILQGRVKTLHPKVYGAILARRDNSEHMRQINEHGIELIDMVVVNLYPFKKAISKPEATLDEALENIDIGGPTLLRAAAKNYQDVAVVVNPGRYEDILNQLREKGRKLPLESCARLACEAFQHTANYDRVILDYLEGMSEEEPGFPQLLELSYRKRKNLRYGENPHQKAAFYFDLTDQASGVARAEQVWGGELSHNNILDLNAAFEVVQEFDQPAAVVIKHTNPCGVAIGKALAEAYRKAYDGDPLSAFGGIVGLNRPVDVKAAEQMALPNTFIEAIIAPDFGEGALEILTKRTWWGKDVRILKTSPAEEGRPKWDMKKVIGGLLVQEYNAANYGRDRFRVVTEREPIEEEKGMLDFAWLVCKHVKSNAIVLAKEEMVVGVGAGQMSRVDATIIATRKAGENARGAVLASDAFFPFPDSVDEAAKAGVTAIIQPGGSKKDEEVIRTANEHNMAMVFTGLRHFRH